MQQLKCSRWTMLPTSCVARSYLSFSGAFMALVYSPYAFGEIGVVRGDQPRDGAPQQVQFFGGGRRRQRHVSRRIEIEAGIRANVALFMRALEPEAALLL